MSPQLCVPPQSHTVPGPSKVGEPTPHLADPTAPGVQRDGGRSRSCHPQHLGRFPAGCFPGLHPTITPQHPFSLRCPCSLPVLQIQEGLQTSPATPLWKLIARESPCHSPRGTYGQDGEGGKDTSLPAKKKKKKTEEKLCPSCIQHFLNSGWGGRIPCFLRVGPAPGEPTRLRGRCRAAGWGKRGGPFPAQPALPGEWFPHAGSGAGPRAGRCRGASGRTGGCGRADGAAGSPSAAVHGRRAAAGLGSPRLASLRCSAPRR